MFCPKCGSEYETGHTRCEACETELVESPPREMEYTGSVTVFEGERGVAEIVCGKLRSCGIDAWVPDGELAIGVVFTSAVWPAQVQVRVEDEAAAHEALANAAALPEDAEFGDEETSGDQS